MFMQMARSIHGRRRGFGDRHESGPYARRSLEWVQRQAAIVSFVGLFQLLAVMFLALAAARCCS